MIGMVFMQVPVEELFLQVERESRYKEAYKQGYSESYTEGYAQGKIAIKNEVIHNMLALSIGIETIQELVNCSKSDILKVKKRIS